MKLRHFLFLAIVSSFFACGGTSSSQDTTQDEVAIQELEQEAELETETVPVGPSKMTVESVQKFIPQWYQLVIQEEEANLLTGDFNGDGLVDFAMIIASEDVDYYQDADDVRVIIYENNGTEYIEKARSGNMGGFFIHEAPTSQLSLTKNVISLTHQGMRYDHELKYRYEKKYDDYMLIGSESNNYGNAVNDGSGNVSSNYLSGVRLENLNEWNQAKEELIALPEKKIQLNKTLLPLSKLSENNYFDL